MPFIARYRKEATEMLDDAQLRTLEERLRYLRELEERRTAILESVREQGKLDDGAGGRRSAAPRPRRAWRTSTCRSSRSGARRRRSPARRVSSRWPTGCSATRRSIRSPRPPRSWTPTRASPTRQAALDGARAILTERFSEDADLIGELRERMWARGRLAAKVREGKEEAGAKFADYFDFAEPFTELPSHRVLAMLRGEKEDVLDLVLEPEEPLRAARPLLVRGHRRPPLRDRRPRAAPATSGCATRSAGPGGPGSSCTSGIDLRLRLRTAAEDEAVRVFAANLRDLLLAAPAGTRATLGLDPGFRTGVKVAVVDATGKVVATDVIYPHVPANKWDEAHRQAGAAREGARGRPDRDRQRHGVPRDRQARR